MSPLYSDPRSQPDTIHPDSYQVHWYPAGAKAQDPERARIVHEVFGEPGPGGRVGHVWVVDLETTEWETLLPLVCSGRLPGKAGPVDQEGPLPGIFLFLSTRTFKNWDPPYLPGTDEEEDVIRHRRLKANEFVVRVLCSYRLGRRVHCGRQAPGAGSGAAGPRLERLEHELRRFRQRQPALRDMRGGLRLMAQDLERLQQIALREFEGRTWTPELRKRLSATEDGQLEATGGQPLDTVIAGVNENARTVAQRLRKDLETPEAFARALRAVYQLGRRPHLKAERELGEALPDIGQRGSILFHRDIDFLVTAGGPGGAPSLEPLELRLRLQARLWAYELLRDLSTWFAYAANDWARVMGGLIHQPINVLIIDEVFPQAQLDRNSRSERLADDLQERLRRIAEVFGPDGAPGSVHFDYVTADRAWPHVFEHVEFGQPLRVRPLFSAPGTPAEERSAGDLLKYQLVLVEVEFRGSYVGPAIVEKLSAHLEREAHARSERRTPALMVLSQTANFYHVQQCLNLGAVAFVRKERVYELPTRVTRARIDQRALEPQGQKANFRALYSLPHEEVSRLQSTVRDDCVLGVPDDPQERRWIQALPKADLHSHIGTHIDLETIQALSFNTVGHLLDRRGGNEELADVMDALIDDVCGIVLSAGHLQEVDDGAHAAARLERAARAALASDAGPGASARPDASASGGKRDPSPFARLTAQLRARDTRINDFEIVALLVAVVALVHERFGGEDTPDALPAPLRTWRYVEHLREWLDGAWDSVLPSVRDDAPAAAAAGRGQAFPEARGRAQTEAEWNEQMNRWLVTRKLRLERLLGHISDQVSRRAEALRSAGPRGAGVPLHGPATLEEVYRRLCAAADDATDERVRERARGGGREELERCVHRVAQRVPFAWWKLNRRLDRVLAERFAHGVAQAFLAETPEERAESRAELHDKFRPVTLHDLVVVPNPPQPAEKNLLRYLWGADLLGADHLQYPENLLLAARSVVRQSTAENIWYTELRCETVGYTDGGMVAVDATDLLCTALDLAVAYGVAEPDAARNGGGAPLADAAARAPGRAPSVGAPAEACLPQESPRDRRWARFSILLGAKRHKPAATFKEIVGLTTYYMQQREEEDLPQIAPSWWKPTSVAGFDLSGDENAEPERPRKMMKPLFKHSTPITIHAGEAADAESIWEAVYQYGARRIGHGLRLRENRRLLNHCISEGLCMELCPISNAYTNSFPDVQDGYESDWWEYYPLRYYMEQGLDVCINTDNRQLHRESENTLTDEYLRAARLVGGLSRWDVLRIVKAGFKHAFLPKREIGVMLRAVESRVYELITDPDGEMYKMYLHYAQTPADDGPRDDGTADDGTVFVGPGEIAGAPRAEPLAG